jgi:transposase
MVMPKKRTTSMDLRERILASYDEGKGTREEVANRFRVSLGMVKKLLQQRRRIGEIGAQHHLAGRKPLIEVHHQRKLRELLEAKVDMTLHQMREALGLDCSLQAIHVVLGKMGLTYKKRLSAPASKAVPTLPKLAKRGATAKAGSIRRVSSSLTKAGPKPT